MKPRILSKSNKNTASVLCTLSHNNSGRKTDDKDSEAFMNNVLQIVHESQPSLPGIRVSNFDKCSNFNC